MKSAYKTCLNFVSNSFVSLKLIKRQNQKNLPSTIPPGLGSLPPKASTRWENKPEKEKPTTPGNRPTSHNQSLATSVHNFPISKVVKVTILKLPKTRAWPTRRLLHITGSPCWDARCSRLLSILHTPARRLRVVAELHSGISTWHWLLPGILS